MYPRYIVKFNDRYLAGGNHMVYLNIGGRDYVPKYELSEYDGSLKDFKPRYGDVIKRRYNNIIEDYDAQKCFFFDSDQEFMEEFFVDIL